MIFLYSKYNCFFFLHINETNALHVHGSEIDHPTCTPSLSDIGVLAINMYSH